MHIRRFCAYIPQMQGTKGDFRCKIYKINKKITKKCCIYKKDVVIFIHHF